jgi:hypothetical protein
VEDELEERDRIGNYPYHSGPDEMMSTKAKRETPELVSFHST